MSLKIVDHIDFYQGEDEAPRTAFGKLTSGGRRSPINCVGRP